MINRAVPTPDQNQWGIAVGDTVTSEKFTGIYRVSQIEPKDGYLNAQLIQVFTLDGKAVKLNRPAYCDVNALRPAFLILPEVKERAIAMNNLARFLEQLKESTTKL